MHTSNEVKNSSQHGTLERYLADEIALNSALDLFCEEVETEFRETQSSHAVEEPLWRAWRAIVTMAASVPQASARRQKLVDFVLDVQKRPNLESGASPCVVQDDTVWQDLPVFGMEMREAWNLGKFACCLVSRLRLTIARSGRNQQQPRTAGHVD